MNAETIHNLFGYHIWANNQVWSCVATLTNEQFNQEDGYSIGSIYNQTFHLMQTDWSAAYFLKNGAWPGPDVADAVTKEVYTTRAAIRSKWDEVEADLEAAMSGLTNEQLQTVLTLPAGDDKTFAATLGELLYTLVNHGTNHRAQTLALIDKLGGKTVEQGVYFYYMQR